MSNEIDSFLAHYGVIGMKWGRRKGSSSVSKSSGKNTRQSTSHLSDAELRAKVERLRLEQQLHDLSNSVHKSRGKAYATSLLESAGRTVVSVAVSAAAAKAVKAAIKS